MKLTFLNFTPSQETSSGKTAPAKVKASDGNTYAIGKYVDSSLVLAAVADGFPLEVETTSKQNGKYTNWYLNSAKRASTNGGAENQTAKPASHQAAPVSASAPSTTVNATFLARGSQALSSAEKSAPRVLDRDRLIVRQTALKAAVELFGPVSTNPPPSDTEIVAIAGGLVDVAELFVSWVFEEEAYRNRDESVGAEDEGRTSAPKTPAQAHLAEAQQKARDRRAEYHNEDAVCPNCGYREALKQGSAGWYCENKSGGCGYPPKGERLDSPISYGEWKQRQGPAMNIRRPDAPVVSPQNHPSRSRED